MTQFTDLKKFHQAYEIMYVDGLNPRWFSDGTTTTLCSNDELKRFRMQPYVVPYSKEDCVRDIKAQLEIYVKLINKEISQN